ncbi:MAG: 30S ribosomal protein S16 [Candidatus Curtissbacteria bacterium]|nr:30S ribosomal protein S16 [Candidatus Curtissbacteria bacterium]
MSVKIRLAVTGKKNQIAYRIVASDTHSKRDGRFLEILGFYNPTSNAAEKLHIEKDKIDTWVKKGAIVTSAVALLIEKGTLVRPKKPKVKKTEEAQAAVPTQPAAEPQPEAAQKDEKPEAESQPAEQNVTADPSPVIASEAPPAGRAGKQSDQVGVNSAKQSENEEIASSPPTSNEVVAGPRNDNEQEETE